MSNLMRESSLYISIGGESNIFNEEVKDYIDFIFKENFGKSSKKKTEANSDNIIEIVYEICLPIVSEDYQTKVFFEKLENVFEDLGEYHPHFTQYKRGGES